MIRPGSPRRRPIHPVHYRTLERAGRTLEEKGLICATDGNLSLRDGDGSVVITASGAHKGDLHPADLIRTDFEGHVLWGTRSPSSETAMHLAIYRARPDVSAIVHAHPPVATAFAVTDAAFDTRILPESILTLGRVPLVPYATPGTSDLPEALAPYLAAHQAFLLSHHGALCLGRAVEEALDRMIRLEHVARILLMARLLGGARPLSEEQIRRLYGVVPAGPGGAPAGAKDRPSGADESVMGPGEVAPADPMDLSRLVADVVLKHLGAHGRPGSS